MKKITFLFLLSISFIGFSQQNNISLLSENLKGSVKSYQKTTYVIAKDTGAEVLRYNEKYIFNTNGDIDIIENYGDNATLDSKEVFDYKLGKIRVSKVHNSKGTVTRSTQYEYDIQGRLETQKKINASGKLQYQTTFFYNQKGLLVAKHKLIPSINYTMKESYLYNTKGQKIEIAKASRIGTTKELFTYNEKGLQNKKSEYNAMGELYSYITYSYNKENDKTNLKKYDADGTLTYFESYAYIYDTTGNWIERISFEKGEKVSVEKRAFVYL